MNAEDTPAKPGRKPSGQVIARTTKNGPPSFSIRFTAYRRRHQLALGPQVTTRGQADMELANVLADVRRGTWRPPSHRAIEEPTNVPTFHEFASSWFERHRHEVRDRTRQYWLELLTPHLLPFFAAYPLDCITPEVVDSYKAAKLLERERWDSATPDERKLLPRASVPVESTAVWHYSLASWRRPSSTGTSRQTPPPGRSARSSTYRGRPGRGWNSTRSRPCSKRQVITGRRSRR